MVNQQTYSFPPITNAGDETRCRNEHAAEDVVTSNRNREFSAKHVSDSIALHRVTREQLMQAALQLADHARLWSKNIGSEQFFHEAGRLARHTLNVEIEVAKQIAEKKAREFVPINPDTPQGYDSAW